MGLGDFFRIKKIKAEMEHLKAENQKLYNDNRNLQNMLTPELQEAQKTQEFIQRLESNKNMLLDCIYRAERDIEQRVIRIKKLDSEIEAKEKQLKEMK